MEEHNFLSRFNDDDVLSFKPKSSTLKSAMCRLGELRNALKFFFINNEKLQSLLYNDLKNQGPETFSSYHDGQNNRRQNWFEEGVDCELLCLGSPQWKSGKIRIRVSVEFCPDEPEIDVDLDGSNAQDKPVLEFPLDDVRKSISETL